MLRLVRGLIAGAFATWVMGKVTALLYEREDPNAREREDTARHGRTSHEVAAQSVARLAGRELSREKRARLGKVLSWSLGILAGVLYAFGTGRKRRGLWAGPAFGAGMFLTVDEGLNTAFGFTPPPGAFPWQAHARGLAGHLVYGVAADVVMRATEPLAQRFEARRVVRLDDGLDEAIVAGVEEGLAEARGEAREEEREELEARPEAREEAEARPEMSEEARADAMAEALAEGLAEGLHGQMDEEPAERRAEEPAKREVEPA